MLKVAIWLVAAFIGLFLVYVTVVSVAAMVMGILTGSDELAGGGFAGLACTVILIVAPVVWCMSKRKKGRCRRPRGCSPSRNLASKLREVEHR